MADEEQQTENQEEIISSKNITDSNTSEESVLGDSKKQEAQVVIAQDIGQTDIKSIAEAARLETAKQESLDFLFKDIDLLKSQLSDIKKDFGKLERRMDKANNFMMSLTGIIAGVFFVSGILIYLEYARNNEERYEKFIDRVEEIKNDFYTKEEINSKLIDKLDTHSIIEINNLSNQSNVNKKILDCLKIKGYFSVKCFEN